MIGVRGRGITYDTGAFPAGASTRAVFDPAVVARELGIIARDLHCTAVRITGGDADRMSVAAQAGAAAGLQVWFSPFPCELTTERTAEFLLECAERAERLRRGGADVVLVAGGELSVFCRGFLPGAGLFDRIAALAAAPAAEHRELLDRVPVALNAFFADLLPRLRAVFGGPITYAAVPFERVDWRPFDVVAVDAYRDGRNAAHFREQVRALRTHGKPVVVTEFGCCTYRGAGADGGRGWLVAVDRDARPRQLRPGHVRDEGEQVRYLQEVLQIFEDECVDTAFWFTFANYAFPDERRSSGSPLRDLDLASYGVVRVLGSGRGRSYPDMAWEPKEVFHALARSYRSAVSSRS